MKYSNIIVAATMLTFLLTACITPPERISPANWPLINAIRTENVIGARKAIANGADPIGVPGSRHIPIHYAASYGNMEIINLLIALGADPNIIGKKGRTALHSAVFGGKTQAVKFFISKGLDVNRKDNEGYTPLHKAAAGGYKKIAEILINHGADMYALNEYGKTPLHVAAMGDFRNMRGRDEVAKLFLDRGVDVNIKTKEGRTPLHVAAGSVEMDMAYFFINNGADLSAKDKRGETPLQHAKRRTFFSADSLKDKRMLLLLEQPSTIESYKPLTVSLRDYKVLAVEVLSANNPNSNLDVVEPLAGLIVGKLRETDLFEKVYFTSATVEKRFDLKLKVNITSINRVSTVARVLLDSYAGEGGIEAIVELIDEKSNGLLAADIIEGRTSAGTTPEAVDRLAERIADFFSESR